MKKVKWGVLGTASIAQRETIPGMLQAVNCELYAIAGRSLDKAEQFKERFGFQKAYGSYEELLEDPKVEAVYIPLPNHLHKEWVLKAAAHKKHVLCEKPMSGNATDTREMVKACKESGVFLMEAYAYLHSPLMKKLKQQINDGVIGEVNFIESTFHTPGYEDNIRIHRETLGGAMYDLGCYTLTFASYLFEDKPVSVKAVSNFTEEGIDDLTCGYLIYPDNRRAIFNCAMFPNDRGDRSYIYGRKGVLEIPISFNAKGVQKWYLKTGEERMEFSIDIPNNYKLEVEQLGNCILSGEEPEVSGDFSIAIAESIDAILKECGYV